MARPPRASAMNSFGSNRGHEADTGYDLPPSTLAANLVNNLSSTRRQSKTQDQEEFQKLLLEFSESSNGQGTQSSLQDSLEHHHKLICIVTKAVLEPLTTDNPFANWEQLIQQASEGLEILTVTIKSTPDVLAHIARSERVLRMFTHLPLWLWLLPRLLTLGARPRCEQLQTKLKDTLKSIFSSVTPSLSSWSFRNTIFCYLRHCTDEAVSQLQEKAVNQHNRASPVTVILPPTAVEDDIGFEGNLDLLADGCTYSLSVASDTLQHVSFLVSVLVDTYTMSQTPYDASPALRDYLAWILDTLAIFRELSRTFASQHEILELATWVNDTLLILAQSSGRDEGISIRRKIYQMLAISCAELLQAPAARSDNTCQVSLCDCLEYLVQACTKDNTISDTVRLYLLPSYPDIGEISDTAGQQDGNLKHLSDLRLRLLQASESVAVLAFESLDLTLQGDTVSEDVRPVKRRKTDSRGDFLGPIVEELWSLLGSQEASDMDGLSLVAPSGYLALTHAQRCRVFKLLGEIPCAGAGTLIAAGDDTSKSIKAKCGVCDNPGANSREPGPYDYNCFHEAIATLKALIGLPEFESSRKPRVVAMISLRSFATHFSDNSFLDLEVSSLGQWCMKSLSSSVRELRIVAGRTLPVFLIQQKGSETSYNNRRNVEDLLGELTKSHATDLMETCVLAWGQVGRISKDEDLKIILLRLVEYLDHTNQIVSAVAFNEILLTAERHCMSVLDMFKPFWQAIAPTVIKDLQTRPQTAQLMADLLSVSVTDMLKMTQSATLPWLIREGKKDIIIKICHARGESDPMKLCFENSNLGPVMAHLLVQNVSDLESYIAGRFRALSSQFKEIGITEFLRTAPLPIALELLKNAGEADEANRGRIRLALQYLANSISIPNTEVQHSKKQDKDSKKKSKLGQFLAQYALGIMSHFSDVLNDNRGAQPNVEKRHVLKAVTEMLSVGKSSVRSALPQICACLQAALASEAIRTFAFKAWVTMMVNLDPTDVGPLLENTFSIILLRWEDFDETSREDARELIKFLLAKPANFLSDFIDVIPALDQIDGLSESGKKLETLREQLDQSKQYRFFSRRVSHEHANVVTQALSELAIYLRDNQVFLQASAISEQPDKVVGELLRSIVDACVKFSNRSPDIARLSAECLGLIGCLDSNRVEDIRERKDVVVVSNFENPDEVTDFVLFLLEEILVKAFLSAPDPKAQGFLSYAMQELLEKCDFKAVCCDPAAHTSPNALRIYGKWLSLPKTVQDTLTPFLRTRYTITTSINSNATYPIFHPGIKFTSWVRTFTLDLLGRPNNDITRLIFPPLCRVIRIEDISVASFLLPFVVLHAVASGTDKQRADISHELLKILSNEAHDASHEELAMIQSCSEAIFRIIDYLSQWTLERHALFSRQRGSVARITNPDEPSSTTDSRIQIQRVTDLVSSIPAETISRRAVECKSFSRALFHWEQHIRQIQESLQKESDEKRDKGSRSSKESLKPREILPVAAPLLQRLQDIYSQIDEPDGIEGISVRLPVLDMDQQVLGHRKAGRWTAVQSWYEIKLEDEPNNVEIQASLLSCLKELGQHDMLLNSVDGMLAKSSAVSKLLPFAAEASWQTGRWDKLQKVLSLSSDGPGGDFNVVLGRTLLALHQKDETAFQSIVSSLREQISMSLSTAATDSLGSCHDVMLKFHVLSELEMIAGQSFERPNQNPHLTDSLDRRLEAIGAHLDDKQYLLGIRRAAMQLSKSTFTKADIASSWLTSARLARKGNSIHQSFNAVMHASKLGDVSSTIENARLLWKRGDHLQAIQILKGAISAEAFINQRQDSFEDGIITTAEVEKSHNLLTARAHLLLAKWLDSAGQTPSNELRKHYQDSVRKHPTWEKGHYYLGRHYNKLLESEKALSPDQRTDPFYTGETAKLVIENYLRSLNYGTKYIYQTLPRLLTLWLDLGLQVNQHLDGKYGTKTLSHEVMKGRKSNLNAIHERFNKYIAKVPAYMFYTALPQIVSRIAHPNLEVFKYLQQIITKVVTAHPNQALWTLLAVSMSTQRDERKSRGMAIITQLQKRVENGRSDLKMMIRSGEKMSQQLLMICNAGDFGSTGKTIKASITDDLGFDHKKCTPCPLAVPVESTLTATLPTLTDSVRTHSAFSRDIVTINSFLDPVLVLSSLQRPRKITARGSDGRSYNLLCKPKDDLRKDQRLMEFNSMINRALKRDVESSKRQLYIKTYAVTPLNEACGIIEWIEGLKTLRDILLTLYRERGISINYAELKVYLDRAHGGDLKNFTDKVLVDIFPVFHSWFVQQFNDPSAWFVARLKYTRSCAVMSMVGTILGLGDRHGENILFEEGNGGTFHVDFNCLFDKGLTFTQPERVPFRLTHNMVDAMGVYGYEGPFRKSSELTLKILRQHEETLMTILEAFIYDPTLDFEPKQDKRNEKSKHKDKDWPPETPQGVLDVIRRKVRGLLKGEAIPLGVEGHVDWLIRQATDPANLSGMYIGWCCFF